MYIHMHIYIYIINNKDPAQVPVYSTGNYIQYLAMTYNGKESEKEYIYIYVCVCVYIYIYIAESLCLYT